MISNHLQLISGTSGLPLYSRGTEGDLFRQAEALSFKFPLSPLSPVKGTPVGAPLLRSDPSAGKGGVGSGLFYQPRVIVP